MCKMNYELKILYKCQNSTTFDFFGIHTQSPNSPPRNMDTFSEKKLPLY